MCFEMVGFTTWDNLTAEEKKEAVELEVWKSEEYDEVARGSGDKVSEVQEI